MENVKVNEVMEQEVQETQETKKSWKDKLPTKEQVKSKGKKIAKALLIGAGLFGSYKFGRLVEKANRNENSEDEWIVLDDLEPAEDLAESENPTEE